MDIQLVNPLDDVVVFEVALTGDGLLGEARYLLKDLCSGLVRARGWRSISSKLFAYDGYPQLPPFEHVSYSWILVRGGVRPGPKGDSNIRISATPSSSWAANWARICRAQSATISEMHRQETDCYRSSPGSAGHEVKYPDSALFEMWDETCLRCSARCCQREARVQQSSSMRL